MNKLKNTFVAAGLVMLVLGSASYYYPAGTSAQTDSRYFPETGHTVKGRFLQYWQQHGGLAQQGYPISEEFQEVSALNGKTYTVQYFERAEFEYHPENQPPYDVLLSQLGTFTYKFNYSGPPNTQRASTDNPRLFPETGKVVGGSFRAYWEHHGGLMQQGYPLTNELPEISQMDDKVYTVQYFERAVFEYHPENAGTPYEVLLSQLGKYRYRFLYSLVPPGSTVTPLANFLTSLDMVSANEGWAAGRGGAIWHYSGGRWQKANSPIADGRDLDSISMVSATDGWAVGDSTLLHYTNGTWQEVRNSIIPGDKEQGPYLSSIDMVSPTEGWAVTGLGMGAVIHYSNGEWSYQDASSRYPLLGLHMISPTEGWAVGDQTVLHYSGGKWQVQSLPANTYLWSVRMLSASDGWGVGTSGAIVHYNQGKWTLVNSPVSDVILASVYMVSADEGWAVGEAGTILHYSAGVWSKYASPTSNGLTSVRMVSATEGWAVGEAVTFLHYQNGTWSVYQQ